MFQLAKRPRAKVGLKRFAEETREMRQLSLQSAFSDTPKKRERVKKLKVYDFFCGAGGYSEGCRRAGHKVVYACDVDPVALAVHKRNHPDTKHQCVQLPAKCGPSFLPRTRAVAAAPARLSAVHRALDCVEARRDARRREARPPVGEVVLKTRDSQPCRFVVHGASARSICH